MKATSALETARQIFEECKKNREDDVLAVQHMVSQCQITTLKDTHELNIIKDRIDDCVLFVESHLASASAELQQLRGRGSKSILYMTLGFTTDDIREHRRNLQGVAESIHLLQEKISDDPSLVANVTEVRAPDGIREKSRQMHPLHLPDRLDGIRERILKTRRKELQLCVALRKLVSENMILDTSVDDPTGLATHTIAGASPQPPMEPQRSHLSVDCSRSGYEETSSIISQVENRSPSTMQELFNLKLYPEIDKFKRSGKRNFDRTQLLINLASLVHRSIDENLNAIGDEVEETGHHYNSIATSLVHGHKSGLCLTGSSPSALVVDEMFRFTDYADRAANKLVRLHLWHHTDPKPKQSVLDEHDDIHIETILTDTHLGGFPHDQPYLSEAPTKQPLDQSRHEIPKPIRTHAAELGILGDSSTDQLVEKLIPDMTFERLVEITLSEIPHETSLGWPQPSTSTRLPRSIAEELYHGTSKEEDGPNATTRTSVTRASQSVASGFHYPSDLLHNFSWSGVLETSTPRSSPDLSGTMQLDEVCDISDYASARDVIENEDLSDYQSIFESEDFQVFSDDQASACEYIEEDELTEYETPPEDMYQWGADNTSGPLMTVDMVTRAKFVAKCLFHISWAATVVALLYFSLTVPEPRYILDSDFEWISRHADIYAMLF
ncbi:hypothetical protein VNI00_015943 [Paramarasmius palmivorus]|uniref:Uncharacterized protein n=1 Tax=Paramarasmius palmivorus TaxID=297713 RepID=A0AAW0BGS1_9AGAR